jgi:hypothetical protein
MNDTTKAFIKDFMRAHATNGVKDGFTQEEHTLLTVELIDDSGILPDMTNEQKAKLFALLYPVMNGSALRQKAEKAWPLPADGKPTDSGFMKVSTTKRGADADALASKYFPTAS